MASVLKNIGVKRALIINGFDDDGNPAMDEISTIGKTKVAILNDNSIEVIELYPEDFGIKRSKKELIKASSNLDGNKKIFLGILKGNYESEIEEARLHLCLVNAGAILFIAGVADSFKDGFQKAYTAVKSGQTILKLYEFINTSNHIELVQINSN